MARIIYYHNLEYEDLPTSKAAKRNRPQWNSDTDDNRLESAQAFDKSECYGHFGQCVSEIKRTCQERTLATEAASASDASPVSQPDLQATNTQSQMGDNNDSGYQEHADGGVDACVEAQDDNEVQVLCSVNVGAQGQDKKIAGKTRLVNAKITDYYARLERKTCSRQVATGLGLVRAAGDLDAEYLTSVLRSHFNFDAFRTNQLEAITASLQGQDTLILMPTGAGKSICYQLPALVTQGVTVVISPLLALIRDQVRRLNSLGLVSSSLASDCKPAQRLLVLRELMRSDCPIKVLFVTPEGLLMSEQVQDYLATLHAQGRMARFVIDEAHCVSTWGASFRKDYSRLGYVRANFQGVPIMAMTATAAPRVQADILNILGLGPTNLRVFTQSYNRPNILFGVCHKGKDSKMELCDIIKSRFRDDCGIVYCLSRDECDKMAEEMLSADLRAVSYHGGLGDAARREAYDCWLSGKSNIVCATIAFGMGIDKANVRFVFHYVLPSSIQGYYQEAGRAGRDGVTAYSVIFYSRRDVPRMRSMIERNRNQSEEERGRQLEHLQEMVRYAANMSRCRRVLLFAHLGETFDRDLCKDSVHLCDNCLEECRKEQRLMDEETESFVDREMRMERERVWRRLDSLKRVQPASRRKL